jgi:hypothetical protein
MRYLKTFENFGEGVGSTNAEEVVNSPEMQAALDKIAKEEGIDPEQVKVEAEEIAAEEAPKGVFDLDMENAYNEEEEPITLGLILGVAAGLVALWGGSMGIVKLGQNREVKYLIHKKAVQKVQDLIKKDPSIITKGYENLVKTAFTEMMADKELVEKTHKIVNPQGNFRVGGGAPL